jgi:hypothetical protein
MNPRRWRSRGSAAVRRYRKRTSIFQVRYVTWIRQGDRSIGMGHCMPRRLRYSEDDSICDAEDDAGSVLPMHQQHVGGQRTGAAGSAND